MPDQEIVAAASTAADPPDPAGAEPTATEPTQAATEPSAPQTAAAQQAVTRPAPADPAVTGLAVVGPVPVEADGLVVERGLDDLELAVLDLERRTYRHQGAKEQAVRDELDLSATRYYQVLNALLDDPAALAREPVLVGRARRLREERLARGAR